MKQDVLHGIDHKVLIDIMKEYKTLMGKSLAEVYAAFTRVLPPVAYTEIKGVGAQLTDVKPAFLRQTLFASFGPVGIGWGYQYDDIILEKEARVNKNGKNYTMHLAALNNFIFWYTIFLGDALVTVKMQAEGSSENMRMDWAIRGAVTNGILFAGRELLWSLPVHQGLVNHKNAKHKYAAYKKAQEKVSAPLLGIDPAAADMDPTSDDLSADPPAPPPPPVPSPVRSGRRLSTGAQPTSPGYRPLAEQVGGTRYPAEALAAWVATAAYAVAQFGYTSPGEVFGTLAQSPMGKTWREMDRTKALDFLRQLVEGDSPAAAADEEPAVINEVEDAPAASEPMVTAQKTGAPAMLAEYWPGAYAAKLKDVTGSGKITDSTRRRLFAVWGKSGDKQRHAILEMITAGKRSFNQLTNRQAVAVGIVVKEAVDAGTWEDDKEVLLAWATERGKYSPKKETDA